MATRSALHSIGNQSPRRGLAPVGQSVRTAVLTLACGGIVNLPSQAQTIAAAQAPPAVESWIWPAMLMLLMLLMLLVTLVMGAVCLQLLRREKSLRLELDEARAHTANAGLPSQAAKPAQGADGVPAVDSDALQAVAREHESFSYTVSHDLRAPIRVVEGFTKILKEDYGRMLDRIGNDHLDRVLGAAARMNSMIDALLALSQLSSQPLGLQPVNLSQLAAFVAEDHRRQWSDREVGLHIDDDMLVQGDPVLLRVVIENLIGNAWKYTSKTARAEIRFCRHESRSQTFTVSDNGAGFDMRFADRLFGVFQRLHSANDYPGTGVGLASVRRIVRRHGGEIWAESQINHGATFHFSIKL